MMAIQAYHRYDEVGEKIMTSTRQRAFLELSAKFDDERKARELELLRRDNALKASEMRGQRLRQQLILAAALIRHLHLRGARLGIRARAPCERPSALQQRARCLDGPSQSPLFQRARAERRRRPPGRRLRAAGGSRSFQAHQRYAGHPAGDAVLATVSHRLSAALRESDKLVRWGGEEFLAVLDPITPEQADRTVERLLLAVRRDPVLWNGQAIQCTISIGYACFPMPGIGDGDLTGERDQPDRQGALRGEAPRPQPGLPDQRGERAR